MRCEFLRVSSCIVIAATLLSGCAVGPDYRQPALDTPAGYRAAYATAGVEAPLRGPWELFDDAVLSDLLAQLDGANFDIQAAQARFRQARAALHTANAQWWPTLDVDASLERGNTATRDGAALETAENNRSDAIRNRRSVEAAASWEVDLWGRIRRDNEAARAGRDASAADLAAVRLSAQALLVQTYFDLRIADAQLELLDKTVEAYDRSRTIAGNRYRAGVVGRADVAQAETQWRSAQAQARAAALQRAQLEHAIAVLLGRAPAQFALAREPAFIAAAYARAERAALADSSLPQIPVSVPSTLLRQRPDIAFAEQRVIEANAQIGIARAAWFPTVSLNASGGYRSDSAADWLTLPNRAWAVGPALAATLFDGGARAGRNRAAEARYDETVALYRNAALTGFREVEDNLLALQLLRDEAATQDAAVQAARESVTLLTNQYQAGKVGYLDVVNVQTIAYTNARAALDILGQRYSATVALIKALGGGWDAQQLAAQ